MLFFDKDETVQHLFRECPLSKTIWRVHLSFDIHPPKKYYVYFRLLVAWTKQMTLVGKGLLVAHQK
jgi:hypothetical protein